MTRVLQNNSPLDQVRRKRSVAVRPSSKRRAGHPRRTLSEAEQQTLQRILSKEQDFIDNPAFYEEDAERRIYDEAPEIQRPDISWYHPVMDDLGGGRRSSGPNTQVLLTAAEERVLFLQYNYARQRIWAIQQEVWNSPDRQPTAEQADELLRWNRVSERLRDQIANTNLALVLAMAKRTRMSEVDFADLVSEGNMALLRAVDKFDAARGFKFSTYACRAILKAFSRQGMKLSKYRQRFPTDFDPKLQKSDYVETKRHESEQDAADEVRHIILDNRAELSDIERTVIEHRFGIESGQPDEKPMTLEQIGQIIGVTKERVRQIQNKALSKIRDELETSYLGEPAEEEQQSQQQEPNEEAVTGYGLN